MILAVLPGDDGFRARDGFPLFVDDKYLHQIRDFNIANPFRSFRIYGSPDGSVTSRVGKNTSRFFLNLGGFCLRCVSSGRQGGEFGGSGCYRKGGNSRRIGWYGNDLVVHGSGQQSQSARFLCQTALGDRLLCLGCEQFDASASCSRLIRALARPRSPRALNEVAINAR